MSSPHLQHLLPWDKLLSVMQKNENDDGITLPVDDRCQIHLTSRDVELAVEHRKYLQNRVCRGPECAVVGKAIFCKRNRLHFSWKMQCRTLENYKALRFFLDAFSGTMDEFSSTKLRKAEEAVSKLSAQERRKRYPVEIMERAKTSFWGTWDVLYELVARGDLETILILHQDKVIDISELLYTNFGGQAVGNGFKFLICGSLLPFYFASNFIIANNLQGQEESWGDLSLTEDRGLRHIYSNYMEDCDGRTFIHHLRPCLSKGVFMQDLERTKELLKQVFDAICTYYAVQRFLGYCEGVSHDVISAFAFFHLSCYAFNASDEEVKEFLRNLPSRVVFCNEH